MFSIWLSLLLPAELPQVMTRELPQVAVHVQPQQKYITRRVARPAGYHEHECAWCKIRWGHGKDSFGNVEEHRCPQCGRVEWDKAVGTVLPAKTVLVPVQNSSGR